MYKANDVMISMAPAGTAFFPAGPRPVDTAVVAIIVKVTNGYYSVTGSDERYSLSDIIDARFPDYEAQLGEWWVVRHGNEKSPLVEVVDEES